MKCSFVEYLLSHGEIQLILHGKLVLFKSVTRQKVFCFQVFVDVLRMQTHFADID